MQILNVSQANNTDEWLEARLGRITGTKAGSLALAHYAQTDLTKLKGYVDKNLEDMQKAKTAEKAAEYETKAEEYRKKLEIAKIDNMRLKTPVEFWKFLAEMWAVQPDGEPPMERGHRLETPNAALVLQKEDIKLSDAEFDTKMWVSDEDTRIACSPDVHEKTDNPTWAIECKSLGTAYHLQAVVPYLINQRVKIDRLEGQLDQIAIQVMPQIARDKEARDFDFIPSNYQAQALNYFVVDESLDKLYFSFYDDRIYNSMLSHVYLTVTRESIEDEIRTQKTREMQTLHIVDKLDDLFNTWEIQNGFRA